MSAKSSRILEVTLIGLGVTAAATMIIAFAVTGFVTGLVFPALFAGMLILVGVFDRSVVPEALKRPTRDEWLVFISTAAVIAATAVVAVVIDSYVWVVIPMAGFLAIHSLYGLGQLQQQYPFSPTSKPEKVEAGTHSATDTLMGEWFETMSRVDIFRSLTRSELIEIAGLGAVRRVMEGAALGVERQKGTSTYVILRGHAQLSAYSRIGRITARVAGPGESMPLASILGDGTLITSIQARSDMTVWEVNSDRLRAHFGRRPEVAAKVYNAAATILAARYRSTLRRLTEQSAQALSAEHFWVNV